jgi:hypothetical protein
MQQDTPEFQQHFAQFQRYSEENLLNQDPPISDPAHVETIRKAFETLQNYFSRDDFRHTLTLVRRRNIESQVTNILAQFDQIQAFRTSGQLVGANLESIITNIQSYLDELDLRFTSPLKTFLLEGGSDPARAVSEIESALRQTKKARESAERTLGEANLLAGVGADKSFGNYFQMLANGMGVDQNRELQARGKVSNRTLLRSYIGASIVIALVCLFGADDRHTPHKLDSPNITPDPCRWCAPLHIPQVAK